jgi:hypothetical protein
MLVATAPCGLIPNCIMTGTVMSDVPPVTTLMKAVTTKTAIRQDLWVAQSSDWPRT